MLDNNVVFVLALIIGPAVLFAVFLLVVGWFSNRHTNRPDGETRAAARERSAAVHAAGDFGGARWVTSHRRTGGWR